jgi:hypothetical protein
LTNGRLVEMSIAGFHSEGEFGVERGHYLVAICETSRDGVPIGQPRSFVMSRPKIGVEFFLMTRTAGEVYRVAAIFFLRRMQRSGRRALWKGIPRRAPRQSEDGQANRDEQTRGGNERSRVRGIYPPTGLGYGNSGVGNIGNLLGRLGSDLDRLLRSIALL